MKYFYIGLIICIFIGALNVVIDRNISIKHISDNHNYSTLNFAKFDARRAIEKTLYNKSKAEQKRVKSHLEFCLNNHNISTNNGYVHYFRFMNSVSVCMRQL